MNFFPIIYILLFIITNLVSPAYASDPSRGSTSSQPTPITSQNCNESSIKQQMIHVTILATTIEFNLDRYEKLVENYYTDDVLTRGISIPQYNKMINVNQIQRIVLFKKLGEAKSYANTFSCTKDKTSQINQFRISMQLVEKNLTNYKKSIAALITKVHAVPKGQ